MLVAEYRERTALFFITQERSTPMEPNMENLPVVVETELAENDVNGTVKKRLSKSVREEIALEYYSHSVTQRQLAAKYGVSLSTIHNIVNNLKFMKMARDHLDKEMQKADLRRQIAILQAVNAAPEAIQQIIKISQQDIDSTPMQYQYVIQNAAQQILDRAGVKAVNEENGNEIVIKFAEPEGMFKPGMPDLDTGAVTVSDAE